MVNDGLTIQKDMSSKIKIDFFWFGIKGRYGIWKDGLWYAMKELEKQFDVEYKDPAEDEARPDAVVLFWEAPCTTNHPENGIWYNKIRNLPNKKILLFAGGPIEQEWFEGFDHVCVESAINSAELEMLGIEHSTAFGINSDIFKPLNEEKKWIANCFGTCASWKRQWLAGEAFGKDALVVGRGQESDPYPFDRCRELGATVLGEHDPEELNVLLNQTKVTLQLADYWGGGQRVTLESMAAGIPVVCMSDSPKNREYVEESGFGLVCEPNIGSIREAVNRLLDAPISPKIGRDYIESKWTGKHYSNNLTKAIYKICQAHQ